MASDSDLEIYLNQLSKKTHTLKQDVKYQGYSVSRPSTATEKSSDSLDASEKSQYKISPGPNSKKYNAEGRGIVSDITALSDKYSNRNFNNQKVSDKFSNLEEKYLGKSSNKLKTKSHSRNNELSNKDINNDGNNEKTAEKKAKLRIVDSESSVDEELARYLNDSLSSSNLKNATSKLGPSKPEAGSLDSEDESDLFNIHNIVTVADIIGHATEEDESSYEKGDVESIHHSTPEIPEDYEEASGKEYNNSIKLSHPENASHQRKNTRIGDILATPMESIFHSSRRNSTSSIAEVILSRKNSKIDLEAKGECLGVYREESAEESVPESVQNTVSESDSNIAEVLQNGSRTSNKIKSSSTSESNECVKSSAAQSNSKTVDTSKQEAEHLTLKERKNTVNEKDKLKVDEQSMQSKDSVSMVREKSVKSKSKKSSYHRHKRKGKKEKYKSMTTSSSSSPSSSSSSETDSDGDRHYRHRHSRSRRHRRKHYFNPWASPPYTNPWLLVPPQNPYITAKMSTGISTVPNVIEETLSARNLVDADQLLKQQVALTRQFLETQKTLYHAYTATLTSSYHYTSLYETEKYITTRRKPPLTFDEAYKMVKEEIKSSKR